MRQPAFGIFSKCITPKRFNALVNGTLPPGQKCQKYNWQAQNQNASPGRKEATGNGCRQADQTKAGEVLPMIGDIGELKRVAIHKPEDRTECDNERSGGCKRPFSDSTTPAPENNQSSDHGSCRQKQPGAAESPSRINKGEVRRPEELIRVKTDNASGQHHSLHPADCPFRSGCSDVMFFQPGG